MKEEDEIKVNTSGLRAVIEEWIDEREGNKASIYFDEVDIKQLSQHILKFYNIK